MSKKKPKGLLDLHRTDSPCIGESATGIGGKSNVPKTTTSQRSNFGYDYLCGVIRSGLGWQIQISW